MIQAIRTLGILKILDCVEGFGPAALEDESVFRADREAAIRAGSGYASLQFESIKESTDFVGVFSLDGGQISYHTETLLDDTTRYLFLKTPSGGTYLTPTWKLTSDEDRKGARAPPKLVRTMKGYQAVGKDLAAPQWKRWVAEIFASDAVRIADPTLDGGDSRLPFLKVVQKAAREKGVRVFTVRLDGRYPGDIPELVVEALAQKPRIIFQTTQARAHEAPGLVCSLCRRETRVYPNVLSGAGINLANVDKPGFFPDGDARLAWTAYPICAACGEAIYAAKHHAFESLTRKLLGKQILLIPHLVEGRFSLSAARTLVAEAASVRMKGADVRERFLYDDLAENRAVATVTFILGEIAGQSVDNISKVIPNVLPTRIARIAAAIRHGNARNRALPGTDPFAYYVGAGGVRTRADPLDEPLSIFEQTFGIRPRSRVGNNYVARHVNYDDLTQAILTDLPYPAESLYADYVQRLRHEIRTSFSRSDVRAPIYTVRDAARNMTLILEFLGELGTVPVSPRVNTMTTPLTDHGGLEPLARFLTEEARGLDTDEKQYALLLGILLNKTVSIQLARGVNPSALRWLATCDYSEEALQTLFVQIRQKLDSYSTEKGTSAWSEEMRGVAEGLAVLGARIPRWGLSDGEAAYWFSLGLSLAPRFLPSKPRNETPDEP